MKLDSSYYKLLTFLIILIGCNNNNIERHLTARSGWVIYEFNASFNIKTPGIAFREDHTCSLPMVGGNDYIEKKTIGTWDLQRKNKKYFVKIKSLNPKFNNVEFEISSLETIQDSTTMGKFEKLVLKSDSIQIICYRILL
ncbi:MAG TPA: hypothetical protein DF296_13185 [Candidatus Margulisbacteria bacterium]|nr:hypothetical protein [Candidatus Margulisiibacteriota bacterium]